MFKWISSFFQKSEPKLSQQDKMDLLVEYSRNRDEIYQAMLNCDKEIEMDLITQDGKKVKIKINRLRRNRSLSEIRESRANIDRFINRYC